MGPGTEGQELLTLQQQHLWAVVCNEEGFEPWFQRVGLGEAAWRAR